LTPGEIAIIGAGPAGISAAIQLKRLGIEPLLFEGASIGGMLKNANLVENYPGFPNGIKGVALVRLLEAHLANFNLKVIPESVELVDLVSDRLRISTSHSTYFCRCVFAASGTSPVILTVPGMDDLPPGNVVSEVHPLLGSKGKSIAVIGAGDAAFDYALNLSRHNRVSIHNRGDRVSCLPLLYERAVSTASIDYRANCQLVRIEHQPDGMLLTWTCSTGAGEFSQIQSYADYLLIAIGRKPNLGFLSDEIRNNLTDLESRGLIHLIGDVKNGNYRQTGIAVGDGIRAALAAKELSKGSN
jgi:thioredoxin reductase